MVEVFSVGLGPRCDPVHLIVQPVQKEAKKLLSILLTEREEKGIKRHLWSLKSATAATHSGGGGNTSPRPLLIADEARCVSLDLGFELRGAHHVIGG